MKVRDFKNGVAVFFKTLLWGILITFIVPLIIILSGEITNETLSLFKIPFFISFALTVILPFVGFYINYTPLSVKNGIVKIPATDQIRTFLDFIIINPITGLYRTRKYRVEDIQNVANGYTRPNTKSKKRSWDVVITGIKEGKSFSQRIDVSNKQVRDEVRNLLKQTISGRVNAEFSY